MPHTKKENMPQMEINRIIQAWDIQHGKDFVYFLLEKKNQYIEDN